MSGEPRFGRRGFLASGAAVAGTALAGCTAGGSGSDDDTVKVGVLEDRSGNFALNGTPKWRASKLAVDEINDDGGILGKQIELFDPDPQSDNQRYKELTRRLIEKNEVDALWAGYSSATREAIRPTIDRNEQLYFYTTQYEGGVCDSYTFAMGATARHQLGTVLPYLVEEYGPKIYTVAADYNFGQLSADWVRILADENDAEVVGEEFIPLSVSKFGSTINRIQEADPDVIMSMLVGKNHTSFYTQRASAGLDVPIGTSTAMAQGYEHLRLEPPALKDVFAGVNYMEEIPTDRNRDFVDRYYEKFSDADYLNEEAENNYFSIKMYRDACERADTTEQSKVIETLEKGMEVSAPEGDIELQGPVHHMTHNMRVARADENHEISFVEEKLLPEKFLSETVGCDLSQEDETTQYVPADYFEEADATK
jgi:branched-chain amino acid transport system substrate-binding protein